MRLRRLSFRAYIWILVGVALMAAFGYIEWSRQPVDATVAARQEQIVPNLTGSSWTRQTAVLARYRVEGRAYQQWVRVDARQFDELPWGSRLTVRYVPINPDWVHADGQTVAHSLLRDVDPWLVLTVIVLLAGIVQAIRIHRRRKLHRWWLRPRSLSRRLAITLAILLWTQVIVAGYVTPRFPELGSGERSVPDESRIRAVATVTQFGGGHRDNRNSLPIGLPQGFDRVELSFVPEGRRLPVVAVDEVDEGSAGELTGPTVAIHYDPENPRNARMDLGTRDHRWKNPLITQGTAGLAVLVVLIAPLAIRWFRGNGRGPIYR